MYPPQPNQLQQQPQQPQQPTIGKRPLYPQQQQQQPPPPPQNHQPPPAPINQQPQNLNYGNGPTAAPYPQPAQPQFNQYASNQQYQQQTAANQYGIVNQGFNKLWGQESIDLMQNRHILPSTPVEPPKIHLEHQFFESVNCSPE